MRKHLLKKAINAPFSQIPVIVASDLSVNAA
jgi:hypothetical protein